MLVYALAREAFRETKHEVSCLYFDSGRCNAGCRIKLSKIFKNTREKSKASDNI